MLLAAWQYIGLSQVIRCGAAAMRPSLLALSVVQLVIVSIVPQVTAHNEGDVQLIIMYNNSPTFEGVLQLNSDYAVITIIARIISSDTKVYSQSKWNTVCYESSNYNDSVTNREAAEAVCRQLGYTSVHRWGSAASFDYSLAEYPSSSFSGIRCPTVKDVTEGEVYLMRCDIGQLIESKDCQSIVGIHCETTGFYDGQIRFLPINGEGDHTLLRINFEGEWRPICVDSFKFKETIANSACRQMGYTNASSYDPVHISNNGMAWKINDLSNCHSKNSFPCFMNCMVQSAGYTSVDQCDGIQLKLTCQFIKSDQALQSSGNQRICQYSSSESSIDARIFYPVTGVLSVGMVILLVVVTVQCCRRRRRPADNPPQAAQPNIVVRWWKERGGNEYGAVHEQREN